MSENSDDEVSQLLTSWGLSDLKAKFKANYIVLQAFEFLSEQDIIDLIPKIGQRAIFRGRLQQWLKENASSTVPTPTPTTTNTMAIPSPIVIQNVQIKEEAGGDSRKEPDGGGGKPKQHWENPQKPVTTPMPTVVIPARILQSRPEKPKQGKALVRSPVEAAPPIIRLVSPQAMYQQAPVQTCRKLVRPALGQVRHKPNRLDKHGTTAKTAAIQSKVQQFYIPPTQDETSHSAPSEPSALTSDAYGKKAYKVPFVTSIIRVETNSDPGNTTKNKTFNTNVSRTTILQKINNTERSSTPTGTVSQFTDPVESPTQTPEPVQESEESLDDSILYPLVKLETELVDTSSWKEFQDKKTERDSEEFLDMEQEETDVDSSDLQMDQIESESPQEVESDVETSISLLTPMPQVDFPEQTRKRRGTRWSSRVLEKLDIRNILMDSKEGQRILVFYMTNKFLDTGTRNKLIRVIAEFCFRANLNIKPKDCREISCKILEIFPNEKLNDYFTGYSGKHPKSSLYTRYRHLHKRFCMENGLPMPNRRKKINKSYPNLRADESEMLQDDENLILS